ncbi:MAG: hypothetical protein K0R68_1019, partial [Mycobacterium sp.]|nr:hypothetical protein [Mycobacterium sp.]
MSRFEEDDVDAVDEREVSGALTV